jgi:hypothetical protein
MAWLNGKKGHWGLEGHSNCTEGECYTCRNVACGVQQGFDPVPEPVFYKDPDLEDSEKGHWGLEGHPNCTPEECPYDCKNVACGVKQGFEPVPEPMFYKDEK